MADRKRFFREKDYEKRLSVRPGTDIFIPVRYIKKAITWIAEIFKKDKDASK